MKIPKDIIEGMALERALQKPRSRLPDLLTGDGCGVDHADFGDAMAYAKLGAAVNGLTDVADALQKLQAALARHWLEPIVAIGLASPIELRKFRSLRSAAPLLVSEAMKETGNGFELCGVRFTASSAP